MEKITTICFAAGHGGGHILPTITKAHHHKINHPHDSIVFFASTAPLDQKILSAYTFLDHKIALSVENIPSKKKLWRLPIFAIKFINSFFKSLWFLYKFKPAVIVSMGGYTTIPTCLAGLLLRIPLELYELNVEPGKAITFLAPTARTIGIMYKKTAMLLNANNCVHTPYPIRFTREDKKINKEQAIRTIEFKTDRKTLLIIGGSQGSLFINKCIQQWLHASSDIHHRIQVIHQIGIHEKADWQSLYAHYNIPSTIFDYRHDLASLYQAADLVISRAGAGTLAELVFFEKKSIIIPLEAPTTMHQLYNAQEMHHEYPALFTVLQQSKIEGAQDTFNQLLTTNLLNS